ncbi:MAG: 3-oxoacyl-[acyl-carrier-protein] reductase [Candidatus Omnitrophica bacterium]|nr:3-oxoacyl-[acyl-carrier-protein] reductase [Candidatus Omnitrophota bacterium]
MSNFQDKTVIITGGSRGIGKACCLAFARAGANIAFTYNNSANDASLLGDEIKKLGVGCIPFKANVRDYNRCRDVVRETVDNFGKLDILINNAGITKDKALVMMPIADWTDVVDTNLGGIFNMTRAAITTFLKQKEGCIINMSSISGISGLPRQTNYSASKAGIIGFSKSLAKEVAAYNVRVNVVCPGYINTDMVNALQENMRNEILKNIPLKRMGASSEVADLCLFLASNKASYITGEVIKIDGGLAV